MKTKITGWPAGSEPYQDLIQSAADDYAVPVQVLAALLWKESRYNPAIVDGSKRSPVGAMGIAQFMPATARQELGSESAALDPDQAVPGAARYLAKLYRSTGTWAQALAAYNWGIGNVQRKGLAAAPAETVDYYTTILGMAGLDTYA
nr:lytic transglycosylase domain-containing protein [Duganella fentianensis]